MPKINFESVPDKGDLAPESIDFTKIPSGVDLSSENIQRLSDRAAETAGAFARRIEGLQATFAEARDRYSRDAQELIDSAGPEARSAARTLARHQEAKRVTELRRNLVASSETSRRELLDRLGQYATDAEFLSTLCASPEMMLGRVALGESKRTAYMQQLDGAGPIELETAARTAIATGDIVLAASIATVIDRRPRDRRPFSVYAFAQRVIGPEHARVKALLDGIQLAYKTALAADREFTRGRADPLMNLSNTLARNAVAEAQGAEQ